MNACLFLLTVIVLCACAVSLTFCCNGETTKRCRIHTESASKTHRICIQHATNVHPTSLPERDNDGPLVTIRDNDDSAGQEKIAKPALGSDCKKRSREAPFPSEREHTFRANKGQEIEGEGRRKA